MTPDPVPDKQPRPDRAQEDLSRFTPDPTISEKMQINIGGPVDGRLAIGLTLLPGGTNGTSLNIGEAIAVADWLWAAAEAADREQKS